MPDLIIVIGIYAWFGLMFIGFGHMVYTSIRDDIRREKKRKKDL